MFTVKIFYLVTATFTKTWKHVFKMTWMQCYTAFRKVVYVYILFSCWEKKFAHIFGLLLSYMLSKPTPYIKSSWLYPR